MKTNLICIYFLSLMFLLSGCHKNHPVSTKDINTRLIVSSPWVMKHVTIDAVDQSSAFQGLTLSFNATSYTTTNGHVVWPANGTWSFTDETALTIIRDDQVTVQVQQIDSDQLILALDWANSTIGGKATSIKGRHVFTFTH